MKPVQVNIRHGFTVIELMVAIGILIVLAGLTVIGFKHLGGAGKSQQSQISLNNAKSVFAEFDRTPGSNAKMRDAFLVNGTDFWTTAPIPCPQGLVTKDNPTLRNQIVQDRNSGWLTAGVMMMISTVPEARTQLQNIPPEMSMRFTSGRTETPILLDAWGNPMMFVPPAGLGNASKPVHTKQIANITMVSTGAVQATNTFTGGLPAGARAFWASAGPDGDFSTGDDNVYSFNLN